MPGDSGDRSSSLFDALVNSASPRSSIRPALFHGIDWQRFLDAAYYHGIHAIACKRLLESNLDLQPAERELLRAALQSTSTKSFRLVQEVLRVTRSFRERRLRIAPYKGPVLAEDLWGSFALRDCADLDFLVPFEEADRAASLLQELGYSELSPIPSHLRPALHRNASEEQLVNHEKNILLELQWSPAPRVLGIDFDASTMWNRVREIDFAGNRVLAHAPEDLFVLLAIHGWKHNWSRLLWVGDVAQLMQSNVLKWNEIFRFAERNHVLGIIRLAIGTAHACFNIELPDGHKPIAAQRHLVEALLRHLRDATPASYSDWHRLMLAARDTNRDKFRQVTRFLLTPGLGEYNFAALPAWAQSGYRAIRLARVMGMAQAKGRD